jgi:hypothetical protein
MCAQIAEVSTKHKRQSEVAIKAFFKITDLWKLKNEEALILLGSPGRTQFYSLKKDPRTANLNRDTIERISYILGIFKALQILFPDKDSADAWVRKPNDAVLFGGKSALDRMLSGNVSDLFVVREYLDAQRGGW